MLRTIAIGALLTAWAANAANFFPLDPGNHWTYRARSGETFEITVGLNPILTNGQVYHKVTGYATQDFYVRRGDDGVLYWLNQEQSREEILADFRPLSGAFYTTPISDPCAQDAQAQERPAVFEGGGGVFPDAREIRYRIYDCADTGVESELYLDNIGLARRVVQTIAGPREFNLVSAKVGPLALSESPGVHFTVALPSSLTRSRPGDAVSTEVTLCLLVDRLEPLPLRYLSSQRYDIAVKNERGDIVFVWSSTVLFAPVVSEELVLLKEYNVPLTLDLPDGQYLLEAWLTTDARERQFAAAARVSIHTEGAASLARHMRLRAVR